MLALFSQLRTRLQVRSDSEHEQAVLRIVIVALVLTYMGLAYAPNGLASHANHSELLLLQGLSAALVLALAIFLAICMWPRPNIPRRVVGMLADAGAATFCMFLAGESGVSMIGVYLFITFGNGFRYGRTYLFACQALCLMGYCWVLLYAQYWQGHRTAGWCLMVALVVLPLYVSTLLKRIQEARARAEEANRAKSSFLANMSHEMRTPLNGIVGVADLLQTTSLSPQQTELMRLMRHSVALLRSLVDDVLDISKIESGRLTIEIAEFDLHATLNGLVRLLRPHAKAKGLAFHAMVDPAIDYRLRGDSHHLRQVLLNLLSNAIKFTEQGEIEVEVSLLGETQEGLRLRFEVRDTGIGMTTEVQQRIFERFVQADDSTTRRYGGTGLGTTIAKQLVELMGGAIGVTSTPGRGSNFWFELPILKTGIPCDAVAPPIASDSSSATSITLVVVEAGGALHMQHAIEAACEKVEYLSSVNAAASRFNELKQERTLVSAVVAANDVDEACRLFELLNAQQIENSTAMLYLARSALAEADELKLRKIDGVTWLSGNLSARVLTNAIHAAITRETLSSAEIIDLSQVLREQRQPLRILVAEDNMTNQTIICRLLESAGHTVLLASNGEEALDAYEEGQPELALLDFNMPERNGLEVCTTIRTMEPTGIRLPIIILSASVTVEARDRAHRVGADEFVGKPFEAANLLQVIDRLARRVVRGQNTRRTIGHPALGSVALIDQGRIQEVERIARDSDFLTKLLRGFCGDVEALLERLDGAISNEQISGITEVVHALKGASLGIGAQQLAARCVAIEDAAARRQFAHLRILSSEMRKCFHATSTQLTAYSKQGISR